MSIMSLVPMRGRRPHATPSRRRRTATTFRPDALGPLEPRITPSGTPTSFLDFTLTAPNIPNGLASKVGLTASTPTQVANNTQTAITLTDSGSQPITVGLALYQDQAAPPGVPLNTEVLLAEQDVVVPAGKSVTVQVSALCLTQLDVFIKKVGCDVVSNVVTQFTTFDSMGTNPGPPVDAGYNVTNYGLASQTINTHATAANPNPSTTNMLGTLVAYAQTGDCGCPPSGPKSECYWESNTCNWNLPTFTLPGSCGGTTKVSGLDLGGTFFTQQQLLGILGSSSTNLVVDVAQDAIVAKLNLMNSGQTASAAVTNALTDLDTALASLTTLCVSSSSALGKELLADDAILDAYNPACNSGCGWQWWGNGCGGGSYGGGTCDTGYGCGSGWGNYGGSCDTGGGCSWGGYGGCS